MSVPQRPNWTPNDDFRPDYGFHGGGGGDDWGPVIAVILGVLAVGTILIIVFTSSH